MKSTVPKSSKIHCFAHLQGWILDPSPLALDILRDRMSLVWGQDFELSGWTRQQTRRIRLVLDAPTEHAVPGWPAPWPGQGMEIHALASGQAEQWAHQAIKNIRHHLRRRTPQVAALFLVRIHPEYQSTFNTTLGTAHLALPKWAAPFQARFWHEEADLDKAQVYTAGMTDKKWSKIWRTPSALDDLLPAMIQDEALCAALAQIRAKVLNQSLAAQVSVGSPRQSASLRGSSPRL